MPPKEEAKDSYNVSVTLRVLVEPGYENKVEDVIQQYLKDYVPDDGEADPVHISDFTVGKPVKVFDQRKEVDPWETVPIRNVMLKTLFDLARQQLVAAIMVWKGKNKYNEEGGLKVLQYVDQAIGELSRTRHHQNQEVCYLLLRSALIIAQAFKLDQNAVTGLNHLLSMRQAFGLSHQEG